MKNELYYPKVLIVGQCFDDNTGGGITLSNLFKGWPKERIAVASPKIISRNFMDQEPISYQYYQIGYSENKKTFPFNLFQMKYKSGTIKKDEDNNNLSNIPKSTIILKIRKFLLKHVFIYFRKYGLYQYIDSLKLSKEFEKWIRSYKPEIIYTQLSTLALIRINKELSNKFKIPLIIHIMDDWPNSIAQKGIFSNFFLKKDIDLEFRELLSIATGHFCISEFMCDEYKKRYAINFKFYHNCIDLDLWNKGNEQSQRKEKFKILYAGRIGPGTSTSLLKIALAIEDLIRDGIKISFEIQTNSKDHPIYDLLGKMSCIEFVERIHYHKLPEKFASVDLLVLPIDFDPENLMFIKYSMPTKVPEYMASGTPILVISPEETAISSFFKGKKFGFLINSCDRSVIKNKIREIICNDEQRKSYVLNALNYVKIHNNAEIVREKFRNELAKYVN
jgi:glycosyltransferase involved in cell wall biosynthesis